MLTNKIQQLGQQLSQPLYLEATYRINAIYNSEVPKQHIKCLSPMTFSQKLYQSQKLTSKAQEIVEQRYEQALTEAKRLEKVNNLLSAIVLLAD